MRPTLNLLIQLQELILIRDEQKVLSGNRHLEQLDASIRTMAAELPAEVRSLFERLLKRERIFISPIADGSCAICGMRLPISLVQAVRLARQIESCPTCAHVLYYPETGPKHLRQPLRRAEPPRVGITRFSSAALMIPHLQAEEKEAVIQELAGRMETEGFVDSADKLLEEALRREAILSTAFDHGLAFPHARGVEGGGLTFALGLSRKGVPFDGPAGHVSRLIFLIVIPTAASAFYLKLLAGLTETFMKAEARKAILAEKEPDKLWKALVKVTRAAIK
jgi:mannitol/fructose-specific phosphotransferase system IIA component (Ntr-type)